MHCVYALSSMYWILCIVFYDRQTIRKTILNLLQTSDKKGQQYSIKNIAVQYILCNIFQSMHCPYWQKRTCTILIWLQTSDKMGQQQPEKGTCWLQIVVIYSMQYILCNIFYAIYSMQFFLCNIFYAIYSMQYILYNIFYAIYSINCRYLTKRDNKKRKLVAHRLLQYILCNISYPIYSI